MTPEELWARYARIWSTDEAGRLAELAVCLDENVCYCDPNGLIGSPAELCAYMGAFQKNVPGARFQISSVLHHHGRTLAHWVLQDSSGRALHTGTSFAMLGTDGRMKDITGFFYGAATK